MQATCLIGIVVLATAAEGCAPDSAEAMGVGTPGQPADERGNRRLPIRTDDNPSAEGCDISQGETTQTYDDPLDFGCDIR